MSSVRSRQREIERERRRRQLRRQRAAAALIALIVLGACFGLLFGGGGGSSQSAVPAKTSTTTSVRLTLPLAAPASVRALNARIERVIEKRSRMEEQAALDFYAARGRPVYCGGSSGRYVALTFDDGPGAYTKKALEILGRAHAKATFFMIGRMVRPWAGSARAEVAASDAVGIHTWSHKSLTGLRRAKIFGQIKRTGQTIFELTSERPALLRPPYGNRDERVDRIARKLGLVEVLWSIDSGDSQGKNWAGIASEVLNNVKPGSIILLHENRGQTLRALKFVILPGLKKRGFIPVTVPELLVLDPPPLDGGLDWCWRH